MVPNLLPLPTFAAGFTAKNTAVPVSGDVAATFADLLAHLGGVQAQPQSQSETPAPQDNAAAPVAKAADQASPSSKSKAADTEDSTAVAADTSALPQPMAIVAALSLPAPAPAPPPEPAPAQTGTMPPPQAILPSDKPAPRAKTAAPQLPLPADNLTESDDSPEASSNTDAKATDGQAPAKAAKAAARQQMTDALKDPAPALATNDAQPVRATPKPTLATFDPTPRVAVKAADPAPSTSQAEPAKPAPAFSLQPAANTPASTYSPAATPDAPPATAQGSTMSQVAVESLSALGMQISKRLKDGNTKFAIELHPADLGRVDVALSFAKDGKVSAHLSFDSPITATAFHARESELRQQLSAAGVNINGDSLSFSSRDSSGSGASPQQDPPPRPNLPQALRALGDAAQAAADTDLDTLISHLRRPASRLTLDLLV